MSKYSILALCCLTVAVSSTVNNEVPTIAISCGNTPLVTLPKYQKFMNTLEFKKIVSSFWNEDTKIVMVLEDELSLEDFTIKNSDGNSLFPLFENSKDLLFFPSVIQPEKAIEMLSKNGFSVKTYNDDTYVNSTGKIIALVDFNENSENDNDNSRQSILLKHNNNISKIFNYLCLQYTNVVLVLTGKINPWIEKTSNAHHLVTRHLMATNTKIPLKIVDPKGKALIYSASYPTLSIDNKTDTQLQGTEVEVISDGARESSIKIVSTFLMDGTKVLLRFRFEKTTFTWELKSIECEIGTNTTILMPQHKIEAQMGLSYFSEGPLIFSSGSTVLKFNDAFQAQSWMKSNKFNDPQEQNSFFTPPILAGLFVTFLMLFIVTWGITMIMDIKTMDRFDDPKGKTISINVTE